MKCTDSLDADEVPFFVLLTKTHKEPGLAANTGFGIVRTPLSKGACMPRTHVLYLQAACLGVCSGRALRPPRSFW